MQQATPAPEHRYFQLALLWIGDAAKFSRYAELVAPVVKPYGAGLERQFRPQSIYAQGMECPGVINLVYYESASAYRTFSEDPAFKAIVHLRRESIRMASVEGLCSRVGPACADSAQRLWLIEIARFGSGGAEAYQSYEREAEPVMERYGYAVDRVLRPASHGGLPFEPDLVKVASFESAAGMERMHQDPAHARIEHDLYPAAVAESIWIVGSAAPRSAA
jgi:uncharacterized protein (DUF1330 family)